ncbi:MAG: manganese efflux pump [Oscillospiraceae bacterium]
MEYTWLLFMALALSMDAFAVAVARGIAASPKNKRADCMQTVICFGFAQGLMPTLGFFAARNLAQGLSTNGNRVAGVILSLLGLKMLSEAFHAQEVNKQPGIGAVGLCTQSIVTSLDALSIGVGLYGVLDRIAPTAVLIGLVTAVVCAAGHHLGSVLRVHAGQWAQILGGIILMGLAVKMRLG